MTAPNLQDRLKHKVDDLPEPLVAEVRDFVLFVKAHHEESSFCGSRLARLMRTANNILKMS